MNDEQFDPDKTALALTEHFTTKFVNVLDIGAGNARESRSIQKLHDSEIWILEGDRKNNDTKTSNARKAKWNDSSENFVYYRTLDELNNLYKRLNFQNYHLIDCDDIQIAENIKFDLICSWLSCGFHYPISTYYQLFKKHSHKNTKYVFDLRMNRYGCVVPPEITIKKVFFTFGRKVSRCEIEIDFSKI